MVVLKRTVWWLGLSRQSCLSLSGGLLRLLGQKHGLDVGQNASLSDGDTGQEFVQFLVVADGQLEVTGDDSGLLVVTGSVACELKNLSCEVFEHSCQVDWGTGSNSLSIVAFPQQTVDTSDWELKSGTG